MRCEKCGRPAETNELITYHGQCENCVVGDSPGRGGWSLIDAPSSAGKRRRVPGGWVEVNAELQVANKIY
jgi:hypothetical protein